LGQVVVGLLGEPVGGGAAEDFGEADGHFGGDAALAIDEFGEGGAGDAEGGGRVGDGESIDPLNPPDYQDLSLFLT
jgi:hypothetical protein